MESKKPLVKCEMKLEDGIVKSVTCKDVNKLTPYVQVNSPFLAIQESTLNLVSTSKADSREVQKVRLTNCLNMFRYDHI